MKTPSSNHDDIAPHPSASTVLDRLPSASATLQTLVDERDTSMHAFLAHLDMPSFTAGIAAALSGVVVALVVLKLGRPLIKLALCGALVVLLAGSYFGYLRRATGLTDDALASPKAMVNDAKGAVDKMNARMREQDQELRNIMKEH